jgi:RNA polymerase sigma-70 factor (ECF subfamily)
MDRHAEFGALYADHRAAVHAYFVGRTGDPAAAADLMQEVFLRAWQRLADVAPRSPDGQRAWLFTVARNLVIDEYRHDRTRRDSEAALRREPVPASPSPHAAVVAADRLAIVGAAIGGLPRRQRVVLSLSVAGGLNSTQIAAALDVPAGTVRYRLAEARGALAAALARYDEPVTSEEEP